eukprot:tig00020510_g9890.t1
MDDQSSKKLVGIKYDIFISHKQSTASDLARIFKTTADKMTSERGIELRIFLDRDDLSAIHDLSANIRASRSVLLLLTAAETVKLPKKAALKAVGLDELTARALLGRVLSHTAVEYHRSGQHHPLSIEEALQRCGVDVQKAAAAGPVFSKVAKYAKNWMDARASKKDLELYVPPKATTGAGEGEGDDVEGEDSRVVDLFDEVKAFLRCFVPSPAAAEPAAAADPRVLLLVGEAGSSKSTFLSFLHGKACEQLESGRGPAADGALPVTCLVRLTTLSKAKARNGLREHVAKELGVESNDLPLIKHE